jgi:hypothetical protein
MIELMCDHATVEPNLAPLQDAERQVLRRALHKETGERFGSCLEFWQALEQVVAERPTPPPAAGTGTVSQVSQTAVKNPLGPVATVPPGARTVPGHAEVAHVLTAPPPEGAAHDSVYVTVHGRDLPPLPRKASPTAPGDWKSAPTPQPGRRSWSGVILCVGSLVVLAGTVLLRFRGVRLPSH